MISTANISKPGFSGVLKAQQEMHKSFCMTSGALSALHAVSGIASAGILEQAMSTSRFIMPGVLAASEAASATITSPRVLDSNLLKVNREVCNTISVGAGALSTLQVASGVALAGIHAQTVAYPSTDVSGFLKANQAMYKSVCMVSSVGSVFEAASRTVSTMGILDSGALEASQVSVGAGALSALQVASGLASTSILTGVASTSLFAPGAISTLASTATISHAELAKPYISIELSKPYTRLSEMCITLSTENNEGKISNDASQLVLPPLFKRIRFTENIYIVTCADGLVVPDASGSGSHHTLILKDHRLTVHSTAGNRRVTLYSVSEDELRNQAKDYDEAKCALIANKSALSESDRAILCGHPFVRMIGQLFGPMFSSGLAQSMVSTGTAG